MSGTSSDLASIASAYKSADCSAFFIIQPLSGRTITAANIASLMSAITEIYNLACAYSLAIQSLSEGGQPLNNFNASLSSPVLTSDSTTILACGQFNPLWFKTKPSSIIRSLSLSKDASHMMATIQVLLTLVTGVVSLTAAVVGVEMQEESLKTARSSLQTAQVTAAEAIKSTHQAVSQSDAEAMITVVCATCQTIVESFGGTSIVITVRPGDRDQPDPASVPLMTTAQTKPAHRLAPKAATPEMPWQPSKGEESSSSQKKPPELKTQNGAT